MYTKWSSRMLCNNQRTCSTVGKRERQLEGYGLKENLNSVLSMGRPTRLSSFSSNTNSCYTTLSIFFMSDTSPDRMAFMSPIKRLQIKGKIQRGGGEQHQKMLFEYYQSTTTVELPIRVFQKIKKN